LSTVPLTLLLRSDADPFSERGVECPGELPTASDPALTERAQLAKAALGERVFVLGHHYQRDEVIAFADVTGDSFKLAREAAARRECGVHRVLRCALHGGVRGHPELRRPAGWCCRTWPPGAPWPNMAGCRSGR